MTSLSMIFVKEKKVSHGIYTEKNTEYISVISISRNLSIDVTRN